MVLCSLLNIYGVHTSFASTPFHSKWMWNVLKRHIRLEPYDGSVLFILSTPDIIEGCGRNGKVTIHSLALSSSLLHDV